VRVGKSYRVPQKAVDDYLRDSFVEPADRGRLGTSTDVG